MHCDPNIYHCRDVVSIQTQKPQSDVPFFHDYLLCLRMSLYPLDPLYTVRIRIVFTPNTPTYEGGSVHILHSTCLYVEYAV